MKDKNRVKKVVKEKNFREIINSYKTSLKEVTNLKDLYNLAFLDEKDEEILQDCDFKIDKLFKLIKKSEINCFLSGEHDDYNIYLEIHAGAGGTESQDWAEIFYEECI